MKFDFYFFFLNDIRRKMMSAVPEMQSRIIMTLIISPLIGENSVSVGLPPGMNAESDAKTA